jgi:hypothetical protein
MDAERIEVVIARDGMVSIEVRGTKGPGCILLTESLEQLLGGEVLERRLRPEHDEPEPAPPGSPASEAPTTTP